MKFLNIDPRKFKHVKSDKKSTTLQHKDGHLLTIAHDTLSPKAKEALKAFSKIKEENQTHMQAEEAQTQELANGGNVGEQRKRVFGSNSAPSNSDMREKHIEHIKSFAKELLGLEIHPSGGKINPKTGDRRDKDAEVGVDKPDWRSGQLESQWNPDAIMHEMAHLMLLPKGVGLKKAQELLDKQYSQVQKDFGYMKQKRSHHEVQPMAAEQILRRHLGLPPNKNHVPVPEDAPPRTAVEDNSVIGTRVKKGNKTVDLIRQSRFLTPDNRRRMEDALSGKLKFHPDLGWQENPDAMGAKVQMYKEEHPDAIAAANGGKISDPDTKAHMQAVHEKQLSLAKKLYPPNPEGEDKSRRFFKRADAILKNKYSKPEEYATGGGVDETDQRVPIPPQATQPQGEVNRSAVAQHMRDSNTSEETQKLIDIWHSATGLAKGGEVARYAEGTPDSVSSDDASFNPNDVAGVQDMIPAGSPPLSFNSTPQAPQFDQYGQPTTPQTGGFQVNSDFFNAPVPSMPQIGNEQPMQVTPQAIGATQAFADATAAQQDADQKQATAQSTLNQVPANNPDQGQAKSLATPTITSGIPYSYNSGVTKQVTGAAELAQGQGELGQAQALEYQKQAANQQDALNEFHKQFQELNKERLAHIQDIQDGHIDPEQYWEGTIDKNGNKVGGHSKILSAIGMIIGGFNPTNSPNAAISFLNQQIDRNMNAQYQNLGAKKSLLEANIQQYGNLHNAFLATRVMLNDQISNELNKQGALYAGTIQGAQAKMAAGKIITDTAPMAMQLSAMNAISKLSQNGNVNAIAPLIGQIQSIDPQRGEMYNNAYVPGVGISASLKQIPQAQRDRIEAYQNTLRQMQEAINFKPEHPGAAWSVQDRARAQTLMYEIQNNIRTAGDMGVWKQGEVPMLTGMIGGNPAAFMAAVRTNPKLQESLKQKQLEYNTLLQQYDLPRSPTQMSQDPMEGKIATNHQTGQKLIRHNGSWQPYGQ